MRGSAPRSTSARARSRWRGVHRNANRCHDGERIALGEDVEAVASDRAGTSLFVLFWAAFALRPIRFELRAQNARDGSAAALYRGKRPGRQAVIVRTKDDVRARGWRVRAPTARAAFHARFPDDGSAAGRGTIMSRWRLHVGGGPLMPVKGRRSVIMR